MAPVGSSTPPDPPPKAQLRDDWLRDLVGERGATWTLVAGGLGRLVKANGDLCQLTTTTDGGVLCGGIFAGSRGIPVGNVPDILMTEDDADIVLDDDLELAGDPSAVITLGPTDYLCELAGGSGGPLVLRLTEV